MDKFVTVKKSSTTTQQPGAGKAAKDIDKPRPLFTPYDVKKRDARKPNNWKNKEMAERLIAPLLESGQKPSKTALTKHILATLSDESNPITHSDIYTRTDYVTSAASGHQRSDGRMNTEHLKARSDKLSDQYGRRDAETSIGGVLQNVKVYIDGYLDNTTDIEMKRIVTLAGGNVLQTASGATHILTSQQLSGSKTHKLLTTKSKIKPHVVRPEWIRDCIDAGKRLPERSYSVVKGSSTLDSFLAGSSSSVQRPA
ncbi:hypothetical protein EIP91_001515 [Steccherinum ochraceum]|uniref:BRCT domain-containing protein n=1 Tax=Steccherinum ochraceum TaxID=92696 RepID=A0A4R0RVR3_9APHY|nr:hypothetical protein EIP91_001515 [Steccherinum ochraceum]